MTDSKFYFQWVNQLYLIILLFPMTIIFPSTIFAQSFGMSSPLRHLKVTSYYGNRIHPIYGVSKFHYGIDLSANSDTVRSILHGKVQVIGYNHQLGNYIWSTHGDVEILYAHLSTILVKIDDPISMGQNIGITGATGLATAEHHHLSIKIFGKHIDPLKFLKELYNRFTSNKKI